MPLNPKSRLWLTCLRSVQLLRCVLRRTRPRRAAPCRNDCQTSGEWADSKFVPLPATWLNAAGWQDEIQTGYSAAELIVIERFNDAQCERLGRARSFPRALTRFGPLRRFWNGRALSIAFCMDGQQRRPPAKRRLRLAYQPQGLHQRHQRSAHEKGTTNDIDRTPVLHSNGAGQSVLGAWMRFPESYNQIGELQAKHFFRAEHNEIFSVITKLAREGKPHELISLLAGVQPAGGLFVDGMGRT